MAGEVLIGYMAVEEKSDHGGCSAQRDEGSGDGALREQCSWGVCEFLWSCRNTPRHVAPTSQASNRHDLCCIQ